MADESKPPVANPEETSPASGDTAALSGLMTNPGVLAALENKLNSMSGLSSGYIENLPKVVKRRVKALKKLQYDVIKIESKFYEEVHALECKYATQTVALNERRSEIVNGGVEPTDSDCDWPSDEEEEEELTDAMKKTTVEEISETTDKKEEKMITDAAGDENAKGIPHFWLTIIKNVDMLSDMVQDHDDPILEHLTDIKVKLSEANPMGFTLEFYFSENEHFTNSVLTKEYIMQSEPDEEDKLDYEGPEIIKCKGCTIDWKKGKNITIKTIKKVQKHKGRGTKRTITKNIQTDSFFNFFNPPEVPEGEDPDDDTENLLAADYEIGHFLRERIIPRAVLYFTGEALDDEEEDYDDEGDDEDGEYDEDADDDFEPSKKPNGQKPEECKQQ